MFPSLLGSLTAPTSHRRYISRLLPLSKREDTRRVPKIQIWETWEGGRGFIFPKRVLPPPFPSDLIFAEPRPFLVVGVEREVGGGEVGGGGGGRKFGYKKESGIYHANLSLDFCCQFLFVFPSLFAPLLY